MSGPPWTVDPEDTDLVDRLARDWRVRTSAERRALRDWSSERETAKRLVIQTALVFVARHAQEPQRIARQWLPQPPGRRAKHAPALVLSEAAFGRWVRAQTLGEARRLLVGDDAGSSGSDVYGHGALVSLDYAGQLRSGGVDALDRLAEQPHAPGFAEASDLLSMAELSPQQQAIVRTFRHGEARTPADADRVLGLTHGQSAVQLRRLVAKVRRRASR